MNLKKYFKGEKMMKRIIYLSLLFTMLALFSACSSTGDTENSSGSENEMAPHELTITNNPNTNLDYSDSNLEKIYFAGGCFWGVEAYFQRVYGVQGATSGYANGTGEDPTYETVISEEEG